MEQARRRRVNEMWKNIIMLGISKNTGQKQYYVARLKGRLKESLVIANFLAKDFC